jgi:stearoyl-CoA desaturase (delta-9 desaturase)
LITLRLYRAEVRRLGGADQVLRQARGLLLREESLNDGSARRRLQQVLAHSEVLDTVYRFRERLQAIWQGAAEGQALAALEQWRQEAEASGVAALQEFARRIGGWRSATG